MAGLPPGTAPPSQRGQGAASARLLPLPEHRAASRAEAWPGLSLAAGSPCSAWRRFFNPLQLAASWAGGASSPLGHPGYGYTCCVYMGMLVLRSKCGALCRIRYLCGAGVNFA